MKITMAGMATVVVISIAPIFLSGCRSTSTATAASEIEAADSLSPTKIRIPGSDVSFTMIPIAGGQGILGGELYDSAHQPGVRVEISSFWIAEAETSYDAFALFRFRDRDSDSTNVDGKMFEVDAVARPSTPYEDPSHGMDGSGFPVVGITQWSALQYARWLSEKTGWFLRLPTEAEWEYACLAGNETGDFAATGDSDPKSRLGTTAWFSENSEDHLHMIGTRDPDAAGLLDILGNVAEWTLDQYDENYYKDLSVSGSVVVDPWREPSKLHPRTVRGGSYQSDVAELSCKHRTESSMRWKRRDPQIPKSFWWNTDSPFVGFRLIAPVDPPSAEEQAAFWGLVLGE